MGDRGMQCVSQCGARRQGRNEQACGDPAARPALPCRGIFLWRLQHARGQRGAPPRPAAPPPTQKASRSSYQSPAACAPPRRSGGGRSGRTRPPAPSRWSARPGSRCRRAGRCPWPLSRCCGLCGGAPERGFGKRCAHHGDLRQGVGWMAERLCAVPCPQHSSWGRAWSLPVGPGAHSTQGPGAAHVKARPPFQVGELE